MRLGTRASALALAQAHEVARLLGAEVEIVEIATAGDRDAARGDKGRWISELEHALLDGRIDIAVHSAKDVPSELAEGLVLAGSPARADARDALCGVDSIEALDAGARVGTSSLRRAAELCAQRDDLDVVQLRGNVDTRLGRLAAGDFDAIVVALAGLQRLGRAGEARAALDPGVFVPCAGQGTLALECRAADDRVRAAIAAIADAPTARVLAAERALVRALDATCNTPVGAYAALADDGARLELTAFIGLPDGSAWVRDRLSGADDPAELGARAAERLGAAGAGELLARAEELART